MISIQIGQEKRDTIDEHWINTQVNRRQAEGQQVCVIVTIHEGDLQMKLSTPTCGGGGGGGRQPNDRERMVFDLWAKHRLNSADFAGGNLVAFLKQLNQKFL